MSVVDGMLGMALDLNTYNRFAAGNGTGYTLLSPGVFTNIVNMTVSKGGLLYLFLNNNQAVGDFEWKVTIDGSVATWNYVTVNGSGDSETFGIFDMDQIVQASWVRRPGYAGRASSCGQYVSFPYWQSPSGSLRSRGITIVRVPMMFTSSLVIDIKASVTANITWEAHGFYK